MKLLLQVLFVQGWLWRDRFPQQFAETKLEHRGLAPYLWIILPAALLLASFLALATGETWAIGLTFTAGAWLLWSLSSRWLSVDASRKELRISINWALGFLFCISVLLLLALALATSVWPLIPLAFVLIVCLVTGWMRAVQRNYLLFRQPDEYAWVLDGPGEQPKGLVAPFATAITDAYWRLPKQILFPQKERHAD